jgi:hypothetical protein
MKNRDQENDFVAAINERGMLEPTSTTLATDSSMEV